MSKVAGRSRRGIFLGVGVVDNMTVGEYVDKNVGDVGEMPRSNMDSGDAGSKGDAIGKSTCGPINTVEGGER